MAKLKRVGVLSLAKFYTILMGIIGFIFGIFYAVIIAMGVPDMYSGDPFLSMGYLIILVLPIFYAIIGFIVGAISALLYNLVAKLVGGIDIEFER